MSIVSSKKQITLPAEICREAGIVPGDQCECYIDNFGRITVVKKSAGAAKGLLKGLKRYKSFSSDPKKSPGDGE